MKNRLALFTAIAIVTLWSCNGISDDKDGTGQPENTQGMPTDTAMQGAIPSTLSEQETKFAIDAANGSMAEIQLGEMARSKSNTPEVKEFGRMMIEDHSKANEALKIIATDKNIQLPAKASEDKQQVAIQLSSKNGNDFDKAYIAQMVKDHEASIELFETGQKTVKDTALKAFIDNTLPVLRKHMQQVSTLNQLK
ncbi:DUF4142 domain-containing protein [Niabella sp. W65]|jgi:putative membrane protein|nr:DUF4142 domain-containing protein [Niabella sp. W65]MCH7367237.1 DUF4142 domain-containing protein [Niabella sp. W65]